MLKLAVLGVDWSFYRLIDDLFIQIICRRYVIKQLANINVRICTYISHASLSSNLLYLSLFNTFLRKFPTLNDVMNAAVINESKLFRFDSSDERCILIENTMRNMMDNRLRIVQYLVLLLDSNWV